MADLINIRLIKDSPAVEAMDYAAHNLGMSRNEMIIKAVTIHGRRMQVIKHLHINMI
ncbi:MAG: hypothetical protein AB7V16_00150 [Vulcanibacillus sp.]